MKAFVAVVENDGFSAAARQMGRSKALLSKYVRELEDELGTLLFNRTTRQLSLTEAGQSYYDASLDIIDRIKAAGESVRDQSGEASGILRVTVPRSLGDSETKLPLIAFAEAYPDITLEVDLNDSVVDLVEERFDVAIRVSRLPDSSLIAKRLSSNRLIYCASPAFLAKHGVPSQPSDLADCPAIVDTNWRNKETWPFVNKEGQAITQKVKGVFFANDPEICRRAALADMGITMLPEFSIVDELKNGALVPILENQTPDGNAFYAVYAHRRHVSNKVRVFVDFMAEWFKSRN